MIYPLIWPEDVNNLGHVAGTVLDTRAWQYYAFLYVDGVYTLITMPGAAMTLGSGLNDHDHLVGSYFDGAYWRGFLRKNGQLITLNITNDAETHPEAINNKGEIAGSFNRPGDHWLFHGFLARPKPPKTVAKR
jgi:hypothetical protein